MPPNLWTLLIGAGFVLCWSSGFVGGRLATESETPVLVLFAWRFILATLLVALWWQIIQRASASWRALRREFWVGSLTMGGYLLGIILAIELGVSAGITALIAALQPLVAAVLAGLWLNEHLSARGWLGMAIATLGVTLSVMGDLETGTAPLWAYSLPVLAVFSVSIGSIAAIGAPERLPMAPALTAQLFAASVVFTLAALIRVQLTATDVELSALLPSMDTVTLLAFAWLILLSSFGGYGFFVASLYRLGVTATSTLVYLTPPVTLVWAAVMFGEFPGALGLLGMAIAIVGVALAMLPRRPKPVQSWSGV